MINDILLIICNNDLWHDFMNKIESCLEGLTNVAIV